MRKTIQLVLFGILLLCPKAFFAQNLESNIGTWGDQGNGTYINPVVNADYSDPDLIRVGEDYYMVCSEFHYMGMPVLHSKDLVNWTIISQVYNKFKFDSGYDSNEKYGRGSWAPAIRYHNDKFYIYFCTPDEGLFMSTAVNPEGPWEPLVQVVDVSGWEDPCPFWDEDGNAYLGRSKVGAGPIFIHKMSPDGKKLLDDGVIVYTGPTAEGTKIFKKDGYYYFSIPEGGVPTGWQTVLRSKDIYGPFEKKVVLEQGSTDINGPHQGGMVDLPNGDWWFMHFQTDFALGRVCHLQPVTWIDGWPEVGVDIDRNGIGEPVYAWKKPNIGQEYPINAPQSSDEFNDTKLGLQWSWNHNPVDGVYSLTQNTGFLSLTALESASFLKAKNTITQKFMGNEGEATTLLKFNEMTTGQKAGLCVLDRGYNSIGISKEDGKISVFVDNNGKITKKHIKGSQIYLRVKLNPAEIEETTTQAEGYRRFFPAFKPGNQFYYSTNNKDFYPLGDLFSASWGNWKGPKLGLFSYNENSDGGTALFDWFHYDYDGPKGN